MKVGEVYKRVGALRGPYLEIIEVHDYRIKVRPVGKRNSTMVSRSDLRFEDYRLVTGDELSKCEGEIIHVRK